MMFRFKRKSNVHERASLFNLKEKKLIRKTVEFEPGHDPDGPVYYANHSTIEDLLDVGEII